MATKDPTKDKPAHEAVNRPLYLTVCAIYLALGLLVAYHVFAQHDWHQQGFVWLLYTALSVRMTKKGERAAIWIFNTPAFEWPALLGLIFVPFGIASMVLVPQTVFERELPDDPEWVFNGDDKEPLPERIDPETGKLRRMSRPTRITTGGEMPIEKYKAIRPKDGKPDDAGPGEDLNHLMTVAQNVVLRYRIKRAFDFLIRAKGKNIEEKIAYTEKEMADFVVKVLRREYTKNPIGGVLILHPDIEELALKELSEEVDGWGIELEQTVIKPPDLTHDLNKALANKPIAEAQAKADAAKGTGEGQQEGNRLKGIAEGEAAGAQSLGLAPGEKYRIDKATEMLKDNKTFVLGAAGVAEAIGLNDVLKTALSKPGTTPKAEETTGAST